MPSAGEKTCNLFLRDTEIVRVAATKRFPLIIYLVAVPAVTVTALYYMGDRNLWSGYPFVDVNYFCLGILGPGNCTYYLDWYGIILNALFYTGWGYALLGCYKLLRDARQGRATSPN